jgi:hypothetical protein
VKLFTLEVGSAFADEKLIFIFAVYLQVFDGTALGSFKYR